MDRTRVWLAVCGFVLLLAPAPQAKGKLVSQWLDREIVVDGELDEWRDTLVYFDSVDAYLGLFNDASALYICLYSQDPQVSNQLVMDGLRLRIEGKQTDGFAVHFPRGASAADRYEHRAAGKTDRTPAAIDSIELELPGQRDRVEVSAGGEAGLQAKISHRGSFVYELRIPLTSGEGHPWAPGLFPGDRFKLLIENPQIDAIADDAAARDRDRGNTTPFGQNANGPYGSRRDPGWTGGIDESQPFPRNRFAFMLKARVELARAP